MECYIKDSRKSSKSRSYQPPDLLVRKGKEIVVQVVNRFVKQAGTKEYRPEQLQDEMRTAELAVSMQSLQLRYPVGIDRWLYDETGAVVGCNWVITINTLIPDFIEFQCRWSTSRS